MREEVHRSREIEAQQERFSGRNRLDWRGARDVQRDGTRERDTEFLEDERNQDFRDRGHHVSHGSGREVERIREGRDRERDMRSHEGRRRDPRDFESRRPVPARRY